MRSTGLILVVIAAFAIGGVGLWWLARGWWPRTDAAASSTRIASSLPAEAACTQSGETVSAAEMGSVNTRSGAEPAKGSSMELMDLPGSRTDSTRPPVAGAAGKESRTASVATSVLIDGRWAAAEVNLGHPIRRSPLEKAPGYVKPNDPESTAVITGRRVVELHDHQLDGGLQSATQLAQVMISCINDNDTAALRGCWITFDEFRQILWPEFPQSRPATHVRAEDAWEFLHRSSVTGAHRMVDDWSGQDLEFVGLTFSQGLARFTNFNLLLGVEIHARSRTTGKEIMIKHANGFVECDGEWKVYMFKD